MINGGFQNYLHLMYGLPNGFLSQTTIQDTSDILSRRTKRKKKTEEELLEEYLASQILLGRQKEVLEAKQAAEDALIYARLTGEQKAKRIKAIIMFMMLDED